MVDEVVKQAYREAFGELAVEALIERGVAAAADAKVSTADGGVMVTCEPDWAVYAGDRELAAAGGRGQMPYLVAARVDAAMRIAANG